MVTDYSGSCEPLCCLLSVYQKAVAHVFGIAEGRHRCSVEQGAGAAAQWSRGQSPLLSGAGGSHRCSVEQGAVVGAGAGIVVADDGVASTGQQRGVEQLIDGAAHQGAAVVVRHPLTESKCLAVVGVRVGSCMSTVVGRSMSRLRWVPCWDWCGCRRNCCWVDCWGC